MLRPYFDRWIAWHQATVNRRIFGTALAVALLTLATKVVSVGKDLVAAYQFGMGDALDAYLIAFVLPAFAINVLGGSFGAALVPEYLRLRATEGGEAAVRTASSVFVAGLALLGVVVAVLALLGLPIIRALAGGFGAEKLALTHALFLVLLPCVLGSGLSALLGSLVNAHDRFARVALAPMLVPLCGVAMLLLLGRQLGIYALAFGTLLGVAGELFVLLVSVVRLGIRLRLRWYGFDAPVRRLVMQYGPAVAAGLFATGAELVDQLMAATLGSGSVATLAYGNKLTALLTGIGALALSTAIFPQFSRMLAVGDWSGIRHTFRIYTRLILLATVPIAVILIYVSDELVTAIFERGAFDAGDTIQVSAVQRFYLLQFPIYLLCIIGVRLLSALGKNGALMKISMINLVINVIGNYILMQLLGVSGIALSTAIVYFLSMLMIYATLRRHAPAGI